MWRTARRLSCCTRLRSGLLPLSLTTVSALIKGRARALPHSFAPQNDALDPAEGGRRASRLAPRGEGPALQGCLHPHRCEGKGIAWYMALSC